jgi:hypothetical protein
MKIIYSMRVLLVSAVLVMLTGCGASKTDNAGGKKLTAKVDACALLTKDDAEAMLGGSVNAPTTNNAEQNGTVVSQCHYSSMTGGTIKQVGVLARQSPTADEARQVFQRAQGAAKDLSGTEPQKIPGLGDDAYWTGGNLAQLNVLRDNVWLIVTANPGQGDRLEASKAAANKILAHMQ